MTLRAFSQQDPFQVCSQSVQILSQGENAPLLGIINVMMMRVAQTGKSVASMGVTDIVPVCNS